MNVKKQVILREVNLKYHIKLAFLLGCVTVFFSCATVPYQKSVSPEQISPSYLNTLSSGSIGCPVEQIQTYKIQVNGQKVSTLFSPTINNVYTWMAQCNGKTYYCSGPAGDVGEIKSVSCAPAQT